MELANRGLVTGAIRVLTGNDAQAVTRLLRGTRFSHLHVDWYVLTDWLGTPGFLGLEESGSLQAFLSVAADPPPAAWIRGMAVDPSLSRTEAIGSLLEPARGVLRAGGVRMLAVMTVHDWPGAVLPALGFEIATEVVTMVLVSDASSARPLNPDILIREASVQDLGALAHIETAAFEPIWRYSAQGLVRAMAQSFSFQVAELNGEIVGYQCSTASYRGAHLARMTVSTEYQGLGVGSALLAHALEGYRLRGVEDISLNTQIDNIASQRLYQRFGFRMTEERVPVWLLAP